MKKNTFRLFALLLAVLLVFGAAGCSQPAPLEYTRYPIPTHGQMPNRSDLDRFDYYFADEVPEIILMEVSDEWILDPVSMGNGEIAKGSYIYYLPGKVKQIILDAGVKKNEKVLAHFGGGEIFFSREMCPGYVKGHSYILFGASGYADGPEGNTKTVFSSHPFLAAYVKTDGTIQPLTDCRALDDFSGMTVEEFTVAINEYFAEKA